MDLRALYVALLLCMCLLMCIKSIRARVPLALRARHAFRESVVFAHYTCLFISIISAQIELH